MPASPSPSSSSSRSSSSSPPPETITKKKKSSTKKSAPDHGRNEGVDPTWAYAPPAGATLLSDEGADAGEFDWDTVKDNDDLELCLIRIPDSIKPKVLDNLKVDIPETSRSVCVGTIPRKHATFDVWTVGADADAQNIGGEEIKSLSCLLPRKSKKGKLYPAPKPVARHLVIVAQPVAPTPAAGTENEVSTQNPPRFAYPKEVLKHTYLPYGSLLRSENAEATMQDAVVEDAAAMDVDDAPASPKKKRSKAEKAEKAAAKAAKEDEEGAVDAKEGKSGKSKKRKGEAVEAEATPAKKSKKTKVA